MLQEGKKYDATFYVKLLIRAAHNILEVLDGGEIKRSGRERLRSSSPSMEPCLSSQRKPLLRKEGLMPSFQNHLGVLVRDGDKGGSTLPFWGVLWLCGVRKPLPDELVLHVGDEVEPPGVEIGVCRQPAVPAQIAGSLNRFIALASSVINKASTLELRPFQWLTASIA